MGGWKVELPFSNSRCSYEVAMGERRQECRPPLLPSPTGFPDRCFCDGKMARDVGGCDSCWGSDGFFTLIARVLIRVG